MTCNFHRQLSGVYREKTCLFIEEFSDALFLKKHPFIKFGEKIQLPPLLRHKIKIYIFLKNSETAKAETEKQGSFVSRFRL